MTDELFRFNVCQAQCVSTEDTQHLGITSVDDVVKLIEKGQCCTLYFCGHQGGDKGNLGGGYTYGGESGNDPVFIFGPMATAENKIRHAFIRAGCEDCVINIFACGGATYTDEEAKAVERNRRTIANNTGCKVCGSVGAPGTRPPPPGQVDPGVLGSKYCPIHAGRPDWKYECVEPNLFYAINSFTITKYRIEIRIEPGKDKEPERGK